MKNGSESRRSYLPTIGGASAAALAISLAASPARAQSTPSAPAQPQAQGSDQAAAPSVNYGDDIVVTAQKRNERLLDVPQSVSVLNPDTLAAQGATQLADFADKIPGLSLRTAGAGFTQLSLRGVTVGLDSGPTVGVYVNDVPYGSSTSYARASVVSLDVGLFDLDRLEVLRGPQGTLYGASTMGGLLKYVTNAPDPSAFSGGVQAGISSTRFGGVNYSASGYLNLPVVSDKIAIRANAFQSHDGGYVDNLTTGRDNVNRSDVYGGRVDVLFKPSDRLSLLISGFAQNTKSDGFPLADFRLSGAPVDGDLDQRRFFDESFDQRFRLASATIKYDADFATFTSISSYQYARANIFYDYTTALLPTLNAVPATQNQFSAVGNRDFSTTKKFTQEIRAASNPGGPIDWLVGGFYTHERSVQISDLSLLDLAGRPAPNNVLTSTIPTRYEEVAAFGNLTWHLTDRFDITGGLRYARNNQSFQQTQTGLFGVSGPASRTSDDVVTYLANARYRFSNHATAYFRYATGYRPGGPNVIVTNPTTGQPSGLPTFQPDKLQSYEAGLKFETSDRSLSAEIAGYYIDWTNIQITVTQAGFGNRANAPGGATIRGAEFAFTARPDSSVTVAATLAYQDSQTSNAIPALGATKGEPLPGVPRFTANADVDYRISDVGIRPSIGASLSFVDARWASFNANTSFPQFRLPSYETVNLRAGAHLGPIDLQVYVRNLFDVRGELAPRLVFFPRTGPVQISIVQPRTFGITATTRF